MDAVPAQILQRLRPAGSIERGGNTRTGGFGNRGNLGGQAVDEKFRKPPVAHAIRIPQERVGVRGQKARADVAIVGAIETNQCPGSGLAKPIQRRATGPTGHARELTEPFRR